MANRPWLYLRAFYARGGLRRTVQVVTCDVLGTSGVALLGLVAALLYVAGPPTRWRSLADVLVAAVVKAIRARARAVAVPLLVLAAMVVAMVPFIDPVSDLGLFVTRE